MVYIGIDPGKSGGIAFIFPVEGFTSIDPKRDVRAVKMPETERDIFDIFHDVDDFLKAPHATGPCVAVLERVNAGVWGHGKQGKMGVTSAFTFGRGVGHLQMALTAAKIPFDEVLPVKWQTVLGCRTGGDKNISKRRAQQLFPSIVKVTHATADALLLAEYCRRFHAGSLSTPRSRKRARHGEA